MSAGRLDWNIRYREQLARARTLSSAPARHTLLESTIVRAIIWVSHDMVHHLWGTWFVARPFGMQPLAH